MDLIEAKIIDNELVLPKQLSNALKWKFPFYRIPKLSDYNQDIIDFSKKNNRLPFYLKFDINNDGIEELMIIQRSIFDRCGRLFVVSAKESKFKIETIKWNRPMNSLFCDYFIEKAEPKKYQSFGLVEKGTLSDSMISRKVSANYPHLITNGYLQRIVYWNGVNYAEERI